MSHSGSSEPGERPDSSSSSSARPRPRRSNAPLVIVSDRGRHSDESRRIVRAQAARASAAQSRVTRARNREKGEGGAREGPQSPPATEDRQPPGAPPGDASRPSYMASIMRPFTYTFSGAAHPPQNPQPEPPPTVGGETARPSYVQTFQGPFANPSGGGVPQQPHHQSEPSPISPGEAPRTSYMQAITRPLMNPFGRASRPAQTPPDHLNLKGHIDTPPARQVADPLSNHDRPPEPPGQRPPDHIGLSGHMEIDTPPTSSSGISNPLNTPLSLITQKPLVVWLATVLNVSAVQLFTNPYAIPKLGYNTLTGATNVLSSSGAFAGGAIGSLAGTIQDTGAGAFGRIFSTATGASQGGGGFGSALPGSISTPGGGNADPGPLQLPRALPRGFGALNQRTPLSEPLLGLLTRTSCFDFGSPGVEDRIHGLLFDLIIGYLKAALSPLTPAGPPVQDHLRIACTCLAIFQGQRANGEVFAHEPTYDRGLAAAWSEVELLDQQALTDSRSAEASLWAVFVISATTTGPRSGSGPGSASGSAGGGGGDDDDDGSPARTAFFRRLLRGLFDDLQIRSWLQVRNVLLEFIYPVSFLDEPCKAFWEKVQGVGPEGMPVVA